MTLQQPGRQTLIISALACAALTSIPAQAQKPTPGLWDNSITMKSGNAKLLPETAGLIRTARSGVAPLMAMDEALF